MRGKRKTQSGDKAYDFAKMYDPGRKYQILTESIRSWLKVYDHRRKVNDHPGKVYRILYTTICWKHTIFYLKVNDLQRLCFLYKKLKLHDLSSVKHTIFGGFDADALLHNLWISKPKKLTSSENPPIAKSSFLFWLGPKLLLPPFAWKPFYIPCQKKFVQYHII